MAGNLDQVTLQELKVRGIKICDFVVFSRYLRANYLSILRAWDQVYSTVVEQRTWNWKVGGSSPSGGNHLTYVLVGLNFLKFGQSRISQTLIPANSFVLYGILLVWHKITQITYERVVSLLYRRG